MVRHDPAFTISTLRQLRAFIMDTLAEALPREQRRVRELIEIYKTIPTGIFAITMMRQSLEKAEQAAASGDVVAMLAAYKDLKDYERL